MNPIEELIFYSELSKLKLISQFQDFLTSKNSTTKFKIDADHLDYIQQQFVNLVRDDAKLLTANSNLIGPIYQSEFGQILKSPLNFLQNKIFKKSNKPQISILTEYMIFRQMFKIIMELPLQINKSKEVIYLGVQNILFEKHFKIFFPHWNLKYCENYFELDLSSEFDLILFNYFFSQNPSRDLMEKIHSNFNGRFKIIALDYLHYQDDPTLVQVVKQLEAHNQLKLSTYYQDFKFLKEIKQIAFHSKILIW